MLASASTAGAAEQILRIDPAKRPRLTGVQTTMLRQLPFVLARGDAAALRNVRRRRGVISAHANERVVFELDRSAPLAYGGEAARKGARSASFDGRGETVAIVDSGVDGLHPDLRNRVVKNVKVVGTDGIATEGVFATPVECPVACTTDTSGGHGTHVAGIAVGDGTASGGLFSGVAPGASLVGISVGDTAGVFHMLAAFDYLLTHRELGVVAVNNSWGEAGGKRFDAAHPLNVATKALHDAGIAVVFSAGNNGAGPETQPEGASDCSPSTTEETCKTNPYSVAPWTMGVANTRKDDAGGPGDQPLNFFSARGDPDPQKSVDGKYTIDYRPTLSAPGTNIRSARSLNGIAQATCGTSAELASCIPENPQYEAYYVSISGTSMAAPHVTGAIAVLQGAARARLGRRLTPAEVEAALTGSAARMTKLDRLYDFPCGLPGVACGADTVGTTDAPYQAWQVGAGALNVGAAIATLRPAAPPPPPPPGVVPAGPGELPIAAPVTVLPPRSTAAPIVRKAKKKARKRTTCKRRKGESRKRAQRRCAKQRKAKARKRRRS